MKTLDSVQKRRAFARDEEDLSRSLETMVAELRAGADVASALVGAAAVPDGDSRVARGLGAAARRAHFADPFVTQVGGDGAGGASGGDDRSLGTIARAWSVARRHGLSLAGILDCAREDVVARIVHRSQTSAALAGPRMTIAILASLPLFGLAMGQAFGAHPLEFFGDSAMGGVVLVVGVGLVCAGIDWSVSIIDRAERGA
nr:hypothetical protein [Corynebacterium lactis]